MTVDEELLTIAQAAEVLQVSEASLRRWTDSGRLPCLRIGGRRERRFRREDLMLSLDWGDRQSVSHGVGSASSNDGTAHLGSIQIPLGSHLCELYASDDGRLRLGAPFIRQGLERGERCYFVATAVIHGQVLDVLRQSGVDIDTAIKTRQLVLSDGRKAPLDMLEYFRVQFLDCSSRGLPGIRVLGEMAAFLDQGASAEELMTFEKQYNTGLARDFPVISLCQYDVRRFSGLAVLQACKAHDDTLRFPLRTILGM